MAIRVPLPAHDPDGEASGRGTGGVAFEDLWRHRAALRDLCQRIVGDPATADDVVQETYLRALRNLDRLEQRPSLMPWLATVARRRSIDELRRRQYQRPVEITPEDPTRPEHDPGEAAGLSETVATVREALTALTDRERELLMRQVNQGLSLAELASLDNSSVASVRSVLSRARSKLRDALADTGTRVLAPIGLSTAWMRRKLAEASATVQRWSPVAPGGYERVGEMATAVAAAAALTIGGMIPAAGAASDVASAETESVSTAEAVLAASATLNVFDDRGQAPDSHASARSVAPTTPEGPPASSPETEVAIDDSGWGHPQIAWTADAPTTPAAPSADNPFNEPEPQSPEDTKIRSMGYAEGSGDATPAIVAVGESECGGAPCRVVWISEDGGSSWTKREADGLDDGHTILVAPKYKDSAEPDNRLYAMSPSGLQVTTNDGQTWETVVGPSFNGPAAISPGFKPGGDERIFLGVAPTWSYDAVSRVSTPVPLPGLPANPANFAFVPDYPFSEIVFAGTTKLQPNGTSGVVYRCSDSCSDEGAVTLPGVSVAPKLHVSSAFGADDTVAAWAGNRLFVSTDGGEHFARANFPATGEILALEDDGAGTFFVGVASRGAAASSVLKTRDFQEFTPVGSTMPFAEGVASFLAVDGDLLLAAPKEHVGSGLYCSTDSGATWRRRC